MTTPSPAPSGPGRLLALRNNLILHQAVHAAATLGIADVLERGPATRTELARELKVHEESLFRTLRALASQGIFAESAPGTFENTEESRLLCSSHPRTMRPFFRFWGTEFYFNSLGRIVHSIQTGETAAETLLGMDGWKYMDQNPELAAIFDDAMTNNSNLTGPAIAEAYDFAQWGSVTDVAGGNGILLAHILRRHTNLRGVLADQPKVLERARQRGFLSGELEARASMQPCDFFKEIPAGCRAFLMKSVIHDWDDEAARKILTNCRRAVPADGALLLVEWGLSSLNQPSTGKLMDIVMLAITGGKERTLEEYRELLASAGFRLEQSFPATSEVIVIEARPV